MPAASREELIAGVDVGGTKSAVVVGTPAGRILYREAFASRPERGFDAMFAELCAGLARAFAVHPGAARIGVSIGGPLDAARGLVLGPPHLPGWDEIPLGALLGARFGRPVHVEHDAKAGALAEWLLGAGRGAQDLVFLTAGTGLGAGIIAAGRLVQGQGGGAGEVGHWRIDADGPPLYGKRGSLEGWSSGAGIAALARARHPRLFGESTDAAQVAARARAGGVEAAALLRESAERLGRGIALLIDLLAPELVIVGSLAHRLGDLWLPAAIEAARAEALPALFARCRIVPAALGDALGDVAPLCAALYHGGSGAG